ncbi:hypothetical protein SAMN04487906_2504 [Zhouia amylolytica]|uniref:DUF5916 domain-containing protein n=1 Tax=Zhouia amylolytica TaxID=376730 RepID=A0A1I6UJ84_9FLAO|nr:DUF5916 domain-containing protein [Zhouia amylolytica]SFT01337.1 hypothetical protein SAMN04487906_2504 [Zhouia amylolytica]
MHRLTLTLLGFLCFIISEAQEKRKSIQAYRIETPPKIDGILNDPVWESIEPAKDFFFFEPVNDGSLERNTHKTEVKMAYDDNAVYFAAYMYDNDSSKILRQFTQRDDIDAQADLFAIAINTLDDGLNETRFFITSAGTIGDARANGNNEDFSYNVVFKANMSLDEKGWYAEFKIPYNALRFPETAIQNWSINFHRKIKHLNEQYSWSYVDRKVGQITQYNGLITGLAHINPPIRLLLFPFTQGAVTTFGGETKTDFSAGMDVKYGLSDNFTLDATLIPDFGQTTFDNIILNLGPFEQELNENRQFFIEGTEMFAKGNLFYSRRIGGAPTRRNQVVNNLDANEVILENPINAKLLNAVKVSGRTKDNLGIGVFNAITQETAAIIKDTVTNEVRKFTTESLANYNIFVLDQQFNKNSSISVVNTSVLRSGGFRDANVSALLFDLSNKSNSYRLEGGARMSQVRIPNDLKSGFRSNLEFSKTKGQFRWFIGHYLANKTYDSNDMGIMFENNFNNVFSELSYEIFEPTKTFNKYRLSFWGRHGRLLDPNVATGDSFGFDTFFIKPSRFAFGAGADYYGEKDDYFEPRVDGRFITYNKNAGINGFVSSDYRQKFAYDIRSEARTWFEEDQDFFEISILPRYRFSDRFFMLWETSMAWHNNDFGYVGHDEAHIYIGQRDIQSVENALNASYNFDPYKAINIKFRNFWSVANYGDQQFFILNNDGTRTPYNYDIENNNPNTNFNIWNIDLKFNWRFAPGSEAVILYRHAIFNNDRFSDLSYGNSLQNLFKQNNQHTLSLRLVYFIDINNINDSFKG